MSKEIEDYNTRLISNFVNSEEMRIQKILTIIAIDKDGNIASHRYDKLPDAMVLDALTILCKLMTENLKHETHENTNNRIHRQGDTRLHINRTDQEPTCQIDIRSNSIQCRHKRYIRKQRNNNPTISNKNNNPKKNHMKIKKALLQIPLFLSKLIPKGRLSEISYWKHSENKHLYLCMSEVHIKQEKTFLELFPKAIRVSQYEFAMIAEVYEEVGIAIVADDQIQDMIRSEFKDGMQEHEESEDKYINEN